jgi:hypothetical protein
VLRWLMVRRLGLCICLAITRGKYDQLMRSPKPTSVTALQTCLYRHRRTQHILSSCPSVEGARSTQYSMHFHSSHIQRRLFGETHHRVWLYRSGLQELLASIDIRQFIIGIKTQCLSSSWSILLKVWLLSQRCYASTMSACRVLVIP